MRSSSDTSFKESTGQEANSMPNPHTLLTQDHYRVSPTARAVAYFRSFSDIPYADKISCVLRGEETAKQIFGADLDTVSAWSGPYLEARYKCFGPIIDSRDNLLELAVGTSIERGVAIAQEPHRFYVGTDLPDMIRDSKTCLDEIAKEQRPNHHLVSANVMSHDELFAAAALFGERRNLTIINEGLWMYLKREEQIAAAQNIRKLLKHYGGIWVTADTWDIQSDAEFAATLRPETKLAIERATRRASSWTGREIGQNYFATRRKGIEMFEKLGFYVEQHPMMPDLRHLSSIRKVWGEWDAQIYEPFLRKQAVWVMSVQ
jgi:hypothetical protein